MDGLIGNRAYRDLWTAVAGGAGYLLLAIGTILLTADNNDISAIWPANALLLAIIQPLPPHRWPVYFAAALIGNLLANLIAFGSALVPLLYGLANMTEVLIAALLLQNRRVEGNMLENVGSVLRFVLLGAMIAPAVSGLAGATIAHYLIGRSFWASYSTWYVADALGLMIFTPLFSGIVSGEFARWVREMSPGARAEAAAILAFAIVAGLFTFLVAGYPMLFVMTAVVMFATFRLGRFGTKISLIITAIIGVICTMYGHGPIAAMVRDRSEQALFLQFYLAVMLVSALPIAAELNARRTLARRLAESEASLRLLASESADALIRLDELGRCIQSSGATGMLLGVEARALAGRTLPSLLDNSDGEAFDDAFAGALSNPGTVAYCEFRPRGRASSWLECTIRALVDQDGKVYGAIGAIRDITLRKEREFSLSLAASTDSLTGALNHAAFMAHIDHALSHLTSSHLALIMIDIDHFKKVNDRHGHPAGDAVLVELAARLRALLRDHDMIGRLGGDELAILLDGTAEELALSIAEAIRVEISARPIPLSGGKTQLISISCGVAQAYPGISRNELLRRADDALYQAKGGGRDRVVISEY
ncbi:MAG: diguanylate cyclase [Rhizorhabdus sp.]